MSVITMTAAKTFKLSRQESESSSWVKLRDEYLNPRLESLRKQNDQPMSTDDTAKLRGQILEIKLMLALENV